MATRMLQRRGTAAEWAAANPILADGEIGVERDTRIIKIGDGVTAWTALQLPYLTPAVIDAKGDLIVGVADNTVAKLPRGTTGQRLTVEGDGSLAWETPPAAISPNIVDALGDLIVGTADNVVARLPRGTTGQRLQVAADGSLVWATPQNAIDPAIVDAVGDLIVGTDNDTVARLARGANGQILSVQPDGSLAWVTPVIPNIVDALGDLIVGTADNVVARLPRGTTGQVLTVQPDGSLAWATPADPGTFITYAPAFGNITGPVATARYNLVGKKLTVHVMFTAGTATATGAILCSLPIVGGMQAANFGDQMCAGNGIPGNWKLAANSPNFQSLNNVTAGQNINGVCFSGVVEIA